MRGILNKLRLMENLREFFPQNIILYLQMFLRFWFKKQLKF